MTDRSTNARNDDEPMRLLAESMLRKEIGLSANDLRLGLCVAKNHMDRGAHADALRIYMALVLCEPAETDFQIGLAHCANLMGEHNAALQAASCVIALNPKEPRGYLLAGRSCLMMGQMTEAREDLADALRFSNEGSVVHTQARQLVDQLDAMEAANRHLAEGAE